MKILYFEWKENSRDDMIAALQYLGYSVIRCHIPYREYEQDKDFMERLEAVITKYQCDLVFSFDYFPMIAKAAEKLELDYLSWVYDSPHWTLYSPTTWSNYNYIFVFDYQQYLLLKERGIPHVYHLPLAVNTRRINKQLQLPKNQIAYQADISFVGSLYERNLFDQVVYLPDRTKGYLDGIMDMQKAVFGVNLFPELISGAVAEELETYITLNMDESYGIEKRILYADMLDTKLTSTERREYLNEISSRYGLDLYTGSEAALVSGADYRGTISYAEEMPKVFLQSKINLNITLRSIKTGIPLRALDIMGAGGFLLSNYQPELAENFVNGEELVMYGGKEELLELVEYYLKHEKARKEIAFHGWEKIQKEFSYEKQVRVMFQLWEKGRKKK